jgi:diguanylate cyclase (GGDEF)-like protein
MGTTASPFLNPIAAELEGAGPTPAAQVLARRARQRRQIQGMIAISYLIDGGILSLYAYAETIPQTIGPAFAITGLLSVAVYLMLSETGITERFKDHYFVVPQLFVSLSIMLVFTYIAPEVGVMFLCTLFLVFNFGSLRSNPGQSAAMWAATAAGLAGLFLLTNKSIGMPNGTMLERLATALMFTLTIGRCMFVGMFSSSMRHSLYQSGLKLKEAYRRIEELAELDELTGAFNRRCIMRVLEEEICRSERHNSPCSIALIDLDHFKRINDAYGHPTGDEVLRTFAITSFANIRTIDRFGRYGGEEFLLVLPDTTEQSAARMVDRLRAIIAELDWSAFSPGMRVTISAGLATLRANETSDNFLARADRALYAAKAKGRNRITSA